ncbi:damage-inducible protein CinA [Acinetobacter sp. NCu2D-2]|uniref:CinA family protein n=1 Tax=Acinetobacter sp. NCu2D-2 TaxID=1608473 RepID=UPI0007CDE536|nr:CinA family protein [Acinetobacter sp. NCu2D-2]ANF81732.1 damage-inducible protein CinA [Acinetobacter sp. NCu2D-2]
MSIIKQCCAELEQLTLKIAFIESASSGYLCNQISIYKNSGAEILLGGLVSYDANIKQQILHIPQTLIEQYTPESAEVTQAMAERGKVLFKDADLVVACTGLLKPGGSATAEKPEGTFFICINYHNRFYPFRYLINGTAQQRLDALTKLMAQEILNIIQHPHS